MRNVSPTLVKVEVPLVLATFNELSDAPVAKPNDCAELPPKLSMELLVPFNEPKVLVTTPLSVKVFEPIATLPVVKVNDPTTDLLPLKETVFAPAARFIITLDGTPKPTLVPAIHSLLVL